MDARWQRTSIWRYGIAAATVALATAALLALPVRLSRAKLVMLYVPVIAGLALVAGRRGAALASVLAFLLYNYFFVPLLHTLVVEQPQDVIELATLLIVALVVGTLVARSKTQARTAAEQAERTAALYQISQDISTALPIEEILPRIARAALHMLRAERVSIRLAADDSSTSYETAAGVSQPSGELLPTAFRVAGVKAGRFDVWLNGDRSLPQRELEPLVATLAAQTGLAVERTRLARSALQTQLLGESERLKSTLISSLSHDLRTPLAVIKGASSNLLDPSVSWDSTTVRTSLETIDSQADRLSRLVHNLLEMSRLEAGAISRNHEPVALADILGTLLVRLDSLLDGHPVTLDIAPDLPDVEANPVQIELVLANLLENAARYAPSGTAIEVSGKVDDGSVVVAVADRGPGIPAGEEDRIFEKFYRVEREVGQPGGTGLGLAIAKGIVEAHGGTIRAESRHGSGATITFCLPRADG